MKIQKKNWGGGRGQVGGVRVVGSIPYFSSVFRVRLKTKVSSPYDGWWDVKS